MFFAGHFLLMDFTLQPGLGNEKKNATKRNKKNKSLCNLEPAYFVRKVETIKFPLNLPCAPPLKLHQLARKNKLLLNRPHQ